MTAVISEVLIIFIFIFCIALFFSSVVPPPRGRRGGAPQHHKRLRVLLQLFEEFSALFDAFSLRLSNLIHKLLLLFVKCAAHFFVRFLDEDIDEDICGAVGPIGLAVDGSQKPPPFAPPPPFALLAFAVDSLKDCVEGLLGRERRRKRRRRIGKRKRGRRRRAVVNGVWICGRQRPATLNSGQGGSKRLFVIAPPLPPALLLFLTSSQLPLGGLLLLTLPLRAAALHLFENAKAEGCRGGRAGG